MAPNNYPHGVLRVGGFWAGIAGIPLVLGLLWYLLSHWGWWKLRRQGNRRPLIRTWHGWVESEDKDKRERNRLRKPPPSIIPRTTTADYSWVFWDPTGERRRRYEEDREQSLIRYLPRWMRSSPFGSIEPTASPTHDLEAARRSEVLQSDGTSTTGYLGTLSRLGRHWRDGWWRVRRWTDSSVTYTNNDEAGSENPPVCTSAATEGGSDETVNTIRQRKPSRRSRPEWAADSEDVERAINNQLLAPTAGFTLANLFARNAVQRPNEPSDSSSSCERGMAGYMTAHHGNTCPRDDRGNGQPRNATVVGLPPHLRRSTRSRHDLNKTFHTSGTCGVQATADPTPQRIRTWTYGIENTPPLHR
ncbi:MAG: hypothetical protein L6R39_007068, partial [Caloplaca ligustica]